MLNALIVYGTTEGHTRKIAHFIGDELMRRQCTVRVLDAADKPNARDLNDVQAVLILASLHMHRYQSAVTHFVREHRQAIEAKTNAFLSVSLSAIGDDPEDQAELTECLETFTDRTGWTPNEIIHVAGALKYTKYDYLKRWVMKRIAKDHDLPTKTDDYEFTDWRALERFAHQFATSFKELV